jgi:hypothetical protein
MSDSLYINQPIFFFIDVRFCDSVWQLLLKNVQFVNSSGHLVAAVNGKVNLATFTFLNCVVWQLCLTKPDLIFFLSVEFIYKGTCVPVIVRLCKKNRYR